MQPPPLTNTLFAQFVQELPADYHQQAYDFGAFARARKVRSPMQLLQMAMGYCGLDFSLRGCAGKFTEMQERISDTAVNKRLVACTPWIRAMLASLFGGAHQVANGSLRFVVIDGSTVQSPGAKGTSYRLHIAIDLVRLELVQVEVTDGRQGENLDHYLLQNGDVVLVDRGYNQPKTLVPQIDKGVDVVLRYNAHSMNLYDEKMQKINWMAKAKALDGKAGQVPAYLCHKGKRMDVTVHLIPLPPREAEQARRRVKENSRKKGHTVRAATLSLGGWVLVLTSLTLDILTTEAASQLYRVRWQVELVIKRLKSILDIDQLRARKDSLLGEFYLHGKLLYAAVIEKIARRRFRVQQPGGLDAARADTPWRHLQLLNREAQSWISHTGPWAEERAADCLKAMQERPRKRTLQTLPDRMRKLIHACRKNGMSNV